MECQFRHTRRMVMKKLMVVIAGVLLAGAVMAHSGGTAADGCHIDHKTGIRHCH